MSRSTRTCSLRSAAAIALTSSFLITGFGASIAQAEPGPSAPLFGSLDFGSSNFGSSEQTPDAPRLTGIDNFRDVAGTGAGYSGTFGLPVNKGVFYRANAITPKGDDMSNLEKLGLTKVYDLRTEPEIASKPDVLPDGVAYENIPILSGNIAEMIAKIKSPEDSKSMMQDMNRAFVTGATERAGFAQLLTGLAETEGAQVFHCTAGKDRTGWTSFLLLSIAGVDRSVIMNDYLLTNEYTAEGMKATRAGIAASLGEQMAVNMEPLLGVEASYLDAGLAQLDQTYGSVDRYLTEGLGLSPATVMTLKAKLLG
ncbi:tyrosine-protein phosphatase [Rhodococcus qingshengii]|uniref:tyrosine-protein phosphatase n=1 Tax=Rhodococcus qingshengii TaxID=334542 RepID=UPI0027A4A25E|nr:tyrosine-protein phosphatase [Rhodococcus qingshengii]